MKSVDPCQLCQCGIISNANLGKRRQKDITAKTKNSQSEKRTVNFSVSNVLTQSSPDVWFNKKGNQQSGRLPSSQS